jgi:hypothetical protein
MRPSFKVRGAATMARKIRGISKSHPDKVLKALYLEAELVITDAKRNYVPVDLGTLRNSGYVAPPEREGSKISVRFGFGGAASAYAITVHETPSKYDPLSWKGKAIQFHRKGRGPKYLEKPLKEALKGMAQRIADRIKLE